MESQKPLALPPAERETFYRLNDRGHIERVDTETGAVVSIQNEYDVPPVNFIEAEVDGKKVLVQSGMPIDKSQGLPLAFPYTKALADIICQKLIEGTPMSKIVNIPGMPGLFTIGQWRRRHSDFEDAIKFARKMRAERLRDEALLEAESASGLAGEFVAGSKLKVDTLKWAAEKDSPEDYGSKVQVSGSVGVVQLLVETGIRRAGDAGFTPVPPADRDDRDSLAAEDAAIITNPADVDAGTVEVASKDVRPASDVSALGEGADKKGSDE
jgi:hypothetical protein